MRARSKALYTFKHINQAIHLDTKIDINHTKKKKTRKPENQVTTYNITKTIMCVTRS